MSLDTCPHAVFPQVCRGIAPQRPAAEVRPRPGQGAGGGRQERWRRHGGCFQQKSRAINPDPLDCDNSDWGTVTDS